MSVHNQWRERVDQACVAGTVTRTPSARSMVFVKKSSTTLMQDMHQCFGEMVTGRAHARA